MSFLQTLAAVAIGGLITLTTQWALDWRRESRRREQREADTQTEAKMAARLVVLDLISMLSLLKGARETGRWWNALLLPVGAWQTHAETLSRILPDQVWRTVGSTFAGATAWNELVLGLRRNYWIKPRVDLERYGADGMHDAIREGAAEGMQRLLAIAMPTVDEDDPLHELAARMLADL